MEALQYEAKKMKALMLVDLFDIGESNKELMLRVYKQWFRSKDRIKINEESGTKHRSDKKKRMRYLKCGNANARAFKVFEFY